MRALPGPAPAAPQSASRSRTSIAVGGEWEPQPGAWLIPVGMVAAFLTAAWLCGELPMAVSLLAVLVAVAAAVVAWPRRAAVAYPPTQDEIEAALTSARIRSRALDRQARSVTVTAQVRDLPRALPAAPVGVYPMPGEVVDVEVVA